MRAQRIRLVAFIVISIALLCPARADTESRGYTNLKWSDFINRLNFGLTASKVQRACVTDGYWYHTFQIILPQRQNNENVTLATFNAMDNCTAECLNVRALRDSTTLLAYHLRFAIGPVSYTHLRAHETDSYLVCRLLLEKNK